MGMHQVLAGHVIGGAVGLMTGTRYRDMCAFRAIRIDVLERLGMREMTYGWNLEMQIRAAAAGLRVREVPVPYRCRISGESKVAGNLKGTLRAGSRILRTLVGVGLEVRRTRRPRGVAPGPHEGQSPSNPILEVDGDLQGDGLSAAASGVGSK